MHHDFSFLVNKHGVETKFGYPFAQYRNINTYIDARASHFFVMYPWTPEDNYWHSLFHPGATACSLCSTGFFNNFTGPDALGCSFFNFSATWFSKSIFTQPVCNVIIFQTQEDNQCAFLQAGAHAIHAQKDHTSIPQVSRTSNL